MGGFSSTLGTLSVGITGDVSGVLSAFDQVATAAEQADAEISRLDFAGGMADKVGANLDEVKGKFSSLTELGPAITGVGAALTGITVAMGALATASVSAAGDMDSLMRGLTAVAGSGGEAATQMERLKEVAKLPGLGLEEAVQGSIRLQAVGVSAQEAEGYMMQFGNALATVGKGRADLEAVITQLVQMSSKSKVVAEDIKPLMERVPQVASIIKESFGTIDTEVLQKAGIGTQQMIATIVGGLEQLPRVSGGIKNSFENMSDSAKQSLAAIGNLLVPLLEKAAPLVESFLSGVKQVAEWFGQLPAPIQAAVGGFAAFVAALGPILVAAGGLIVAVGSLSTALGTVGLTIGGVTAVIAPWVLAIAAVTAALAALGVWIYENWDPIVATLSQAWAGLTELWNTAWGLIKGNLEMQWTAISTLVKTLWEPISTFFSVIWAVIGPYFVTAWEAIKTSLETVWNAIKTAASTVWNAIIDVFMKFMEWANKIPGVNKLINLDEAWRSADKLKTGMTAATTSVQKFSEKAKPAKVDAVALAEANTKAGKAAKEHADKMKPLITHNVELDATYKELIKRQKDAAEWLAKYKLDLDAGKIATTQMIQPTEELAANIAKIETELTDVSKLAAPPFKSSLDEMKQKANDLDTAFKTLGTTSHTEYKRVADEAKLAYDAVLQHPMSTQWEKDNALVKVLEAQKQAAIAAGTEIPAEIDTQLAAIKTKLEDPAKGVPSFKGPWENFSNEVSTVITNFTQDIAKSLFEGDMSWGEKAKGMLKSLGAAVTSSFIQPATEALTKFINGVLADLMSGKGFGGVLDQLGKIGESITGIFKSGAPSVPGVPSTPGAPSAPGGGAGGALGGLGGTINVISGAVSAISDVIGIFQSAKQETTLNAIEHNTRYSMMYLGERSDGGILGRLFDIADKTQWMPAQLDGINQKLNDWLEPLHTDLQNIWTDASITRMAVQAIESSLGYIKGLMETDRNNLQAIRDEIVTGGNWTVTFQGDPIARMVGDEIMRQLRLQGVKLV